MQMPLSSLAFDFGTVSPDFFFNSLSSLFAGEVIVVEGPNEGIGEREEHADSLLVGCVRRVLAGRHMLREHCGMHKERSDGQKGMVRHSGHSQVEAMKS